MKTSAVYLLLWVMYLPFALAQFNIHTSHHHGTSCSKFHLTPDGKTKIQSTHANGSLKKFTPEDDVSLEVIRTYTCIQYGDYIYYVPEKPLVKLIFNPLPYRGPPVL